MIIIDWIPKIINLQVNDKPRDRIDAHYWNALWNLLIEQGNHNSEAISNLFDNINNLEVDASELNIVFPEASKDKLGCVKIGEHLYLTEDGALTVDFQTVEDKILTTQEITAIARTQVNNFMGDYQTKFPVGAVFVTSTNESPASYLGGTWECYDKHLKAVWYDNENTPGLLALDAANVSNALVYIAAHDHSVIIQITFTLLNEITAFDSNLELGTLDFSKVGVNRINNACYSSQATDPSNAVALIELLHSTGSMMLYDLISKNNQTSLPAGTKIRAVFNATVGIAHMRDEFCDKFFWKRIK